MENGLIEFGESRKVSEVQIFIVPKIGEVKIKGQHIEVKIANTDYVLSEFDMLALADEVDNDKDFDTIIRFLDRFVPASNHTYFTLRCALKQSWAAWDIQARNAYNASNVKTYIMVDENTGLTKIGRSVNPTKREKTLQSEKPTISLLKICDELVESKLHKEYKKKRIRGEWFNLSAGDIKNIIDKYNFHDYE